MEIGDQEEDPTVTAHDPVHDILTPRRSEDLPSLERPVERAAAADRLLWGGARNAYAYAGVRDEAVWVALSDGTPVQTLAESVGVQPAEIHRMAGAHTVRRAEAGLHTWGPAPRRPSDP